MKHEEKIKLDNFREHYNSIMGNIVIANKELENILSQKNKIELRIKLSKEKEEIALNKLKQSRERDRESRILNSIIKKKQQIITREESTLIDLIKVSRTRKEKKINENIKNRKELLDRLENKITRTKQTEVNLKSQLPLLKEINKKLIKKNEDNYKQFLLNKTKQKEESYQIEKEISKKHKELSLLNIKIFKEKEKVILPSQLLEEREIELKRKENNFLILTLRWKRFFKEHFPNQILKL